MGTNELPDAALDFVGQACLLSVTWLFLTVIFASAETVRAHEHGQNHVELDPPRVPTLSSLRGLTLLTVSCGTATKTSC